MSAIDWRRWVGMAILWGLLALLLGYFSNRPSYRHLAADAATIKLSLRHAGQLVGECRERSVEEMANLPANMRTPLICPRERSPLVLEMMFDGELVLSETLPARGLHSDGRASIYRRITVPAGKVEVTVRLKDQIASEDFQYQSAQSVDLPPGANLVIDFDGQAGEFQFL